VHQSWSSFLDRYLGPPFTTKDSLLVSTTLFLFAAYVMGQLLSPYAKLVQRLGESRLVQRIAIARSKFVQRIEIAIARSKLCQRIEKWLGIIKQESEPKSMQESEPKPMPNADKGAYDWLRIHSKEAGAQCAKIRAEFTMHNGLAVVFFASSVCYPVQ